MDTSVEQYPALEATPPPAPASRLANLAAVLITLGVLTLLVGLSIGSGGTGYWYHGPMHRIAHQDATSNNGPAIGGLHR